MPPTCRCPQHDDRHHLAVCAATLALPDVVAYRQENSHVPYAARLTAFRESLASWVWTLLRCTIPDEGATSGYALAVGLVGQAVRHVGDRAPWAYSTHRAAVAYALSLDPDVHGDELQQVPERFGLDDADDGALPIDLNPTTVR